MSTEMTEVFRNDYAVVKFQHDVGEWQLFMHVEILKWSHNIYLHSLLIFEAIKAEMRKQGATKIHGVVPQSDRKHQKFVELYGFEKTSYVLTNIENNELSDIWLFNLEED